MNKYWWSYNEDGDFFDSECTIESCIAEAKIYDNPCPKYVYIGEFMCHVPTIGAEDILEKLYEEAYEENEQCDESYLDVPTEQLNELDNKLNVVLNKWIKKYNLHADFGEIVNIKRYELR